ncbi:MAG: MBL fold metallo-hydrolase [Clostridiales bacterium]|nr:MBL fold metallo-hydrolase [Clostridiales bacterium]
MKKSLVSTLCLFFLICLVAASCAQGSYAQVYDTNDDAGKLTARFINMITDTGDKSGDATILTSPDGKVMLIDAGDPAAAGQVVAALQEMGITHIDFLVASHPHVDHIGGFPAVMQAFEIGQVMTSYIVYPTVYYDAYMAEITAQDLEHVYLSRGDVFAFGDDVTVEVLWPESEIAYYDGYPQSSTQFVNNLSLAMKFTYGESKMLFSGDLYSSAERELVALYGDLLDCDVLKANHHGDSTSSCKPFREAVSPQITVMISDILSDLNTYKKFVKDGSTVYITHYNGNVKVSTIGDGTYQVLAEQAWEFGF